MMTMTMMMMLSATLAIMATTMTNPLSIGLTLLMMTTTTALTTSKLTMSSWFSYVLFLIFMGGMMVLFIYVTSLAPNEKFKISKQTTTITMTATATMLLMATSHYLQPWEIMPLTSNMNETSTAEMSMKNLSAKIYNSSTYLITLITMNYLLLTLIAVVKITNSFEGPMRMQK